MKKSEVYGKRIECILGFILLLPPIIGVVAFTICIFSNSYAGDFACMKYLGENWTAIVRVPQHETFDLLSNGITGSAAAMSAAPFYLGLMAIAGAYLVKNNMQSFFTKGE